MGIIRFCETSQIWVRINRIAPENLKVGNKKNQWKRRNQICRSDSYRWVLSNDQAKKNFTRLDCLVQKLRKGKLNNKHNSWERKQTYTI